MIMYPKNKYSFLIVREEVSLISDDSAFQARGPATKKALSVTWSRACGIMKFPCTLDRSRVSSQRLTSSDRYCGAVP